jgi:hypothetical protein
MKIHSLHIRVSVSTNEIVPNNVPSVQQTLISSCEMETINIKMNKNQTVSFLQDPPPLPI